MGKEIGSRIYLILLGILAAITGLAMIPAWDLTAWIVPLFGTGLGIIGLTTVGLKRFTNMSTIKKLGAAQWTTLIISSLVVIVSVLNAPIFEFSTGIFGTITGVVVVLEAIPLTIEAVVN